MRIPAALLLLSACPQPEPAPADARVFINALLEASRACDPGFLDDAEPIFLAAQVDAQVEIAVAAFTRNLANENVEFSRPAYDACLRAAQEEDCATLEQSQGPCSNVFRGRVGAEAVCAENVECAPGLSCFQERAQCGVCRAEAVFGETCADRNCGDGLFCGENGLCQQQPQPTLFSAGDPCTALAGCGGLSAGLVCIEELCAPIVVVDEGDPCELGLQADRYCRNSSSTHICENGICTKRPTLGDACSASGACDSTVAACQNGQCVDEGQPGDVCENGLGCQLGALCREGVCTALVDVPAPPSCR